MCVTNTKQISQYRNLNSSLCFFFSHSLFFYNDVMNETRIYFVNMIYIPLYIYIYVINYFDKYNKKKDCVKKMMKEHDVTKKKHQIKLCVVCIVSPRERVFMFFRSQIMDGWYSRSLLLSHSHSISKIRRSSCIGGWAVLFKILLELSYQLMLLVHVNLAG